MVRTWVNTYYVSTTGTVRKLFIDRNCSKERKKAFSILLCDIRGRGARTNRDGLKHTKFINDGNFHQKTKPRPLGTSYHTSTLRVSKKRLCEVVI